MLKHILLLAPICVTIFWSIILNTKSDAQSTPRQFLGKFMLSASVVYISHLFFFTPLPKLYSYIDPFYQYASLLVFPLYHIYIRLLTVDQRFSFQKHARYLATPTILFVAYFIGIAIAPLNEYRTGIFNRDFSSPDTHFLKIVFVAMRITFLIQVIYTVIGNYILIRKYGDRAKQFYANIQDSSTQKVNILNISMIIVGIAALILGALGKDFFIDQNAGIAIVLVSFSVMLFIFGWLGYQQKNLNPDYEQQLITTATVEFSSSIQKEIIQKILVLFEEKKIHLQSKLNIQDLAQAVGTNRTYISSAINQHFNQNFCNFVNNYRVDELEKVIQKKSDYRNVLLAESCGFGSVDSMKRAVRSKTGLTFSDWKKQTLQSKKKVKTTRQTPQKF